MRNQLVLLTRVNGKVAETWEVNDLHVLVKISSFRFLALEPEDLGRESEFGQLGLRRMLAIMGPGDWILGFHG